MDNPQSSIPNNYPASVGRLEVVLEPKAFLNGNVELRITTIVNGNIVGKVLLLRPDHFESLFDVMWRKAKQEVDDVIENAFEEERKNRRPETYGEAIEMFAMSRHEALKREGEI